MLEINLKDKWRSEKKYFLSYITEIRLIFLIYKKILEINKKKENNEVRVK